jgi:hypothetical protein
MATGKERRKQIFNVYSNNLELLKAEGIINGEFKDRNIYVCPLCLNNFTLENTENPLTLEDAPPKSLGGRADVLTCKKCNNTCGYKIDAHLTNGLKQLDSHSFIPGTKSKVRVKIGNETYQGELLVEKDGTLKMLHSNKNNHPKKLDNTMNTLGDEDIVDMQFIQSNVIPEHMDYALLKTGYLLTFKKFGYALILDDCFNVVREQLLNPEQQIYPSGFWFTPPYPSGVYFVCNEGLESLMAVFELKTEFTRRVYTTLLPLPIRSINEVIKSLHEKSKQEKKFSLELYPSEQGGNEYLVDSANIKAMIDWINQRSKKSNSNG